MNREIKFRAWNIPNKLMYDNVQDGILAENEKGQLVLGVSLGKLSKDAGSILMQFTGLKDKNGIDIYEEDIVKTEHAFVKTGIIIYTKHSFEIQGICDEDSLIKNYDWSGIEIIGNIYENPELL